MLVLGLVIVAISLYKLGAYQTQTHFRQDVVDQATDEYAPIELSSDYGFTTLFDDRVFDVEYLDEGSAHVATKSRHLDKTVMQLTLTARPEDVYPRDAALRIQILVDTELPIADESFLVQEVESKQVLVGGSNASHRIFSLTPQTGTIKSLTYVHQWLIEGDEHVVEIRAEGLSEKALPAVAGKVIADFSFHGSVLGAKTGSFAAGILSSTALAASPQNDYVIDAVSPAVVKLYHITCGKLIVFGEPLTSESCQVTTGSGFFVSSDGYIATNGHVVVNQPEDIFVKVLLADPGSLATFLNGAGLTGSEISGISKNPVLLASIISKVYDLPDAAIQLENETHSYFAALGQEPLRIESIEDAQNIRNFQGRNSLQPVQLIAKNYASKDVYSVSAGEGFSASDVALLKVDIDDTPFIRLFDKSVTQNMAISIVGFPGDAENFLIDKSELATTITNGSISAIRGSSGSSDYTLYQSDADASQGNSGGPVLTAAGQAIGLLTYRYQSSEQTDAAKSYIRDINDLAKLARVNNVVFKFDGVTQSSWETGLELYATNRYSKALVEFRKVADSYPSHRLVGSYILDAEKAVAQGRDVQDTPALLVVGAVIGMFGAVSAVVLIARQHGNHQLFKLTHVKSTDKQPHPAV